MQVSCMNVFLLSYRKDKSKTKHKVETLLQSRYGGWRSGSGAAALAEDPGSDPSIHKAVLNRR